MESGVLREVGKRSLGQYTLLNGKYNGLSIDINRDYAEVFITKNDKEIANFQFDFDFNEIGRNIEFVGLEHFDQPGYEHLLNKLKPEDFKNPDYVSESSDKGSNQSQD